MPFYKLRLFKTIADADGYFSIYWKDFDIPFVPWIGLSIADFDVGFNDVGIQIKSLVWSSKLFGFVASSEGLKVGNKDLSDEDKKKVLDWMDKKHKLLIDSGWSDEDSDEGEPTDPQTP